MYHNAAEEAYACPLAYILHPGVTHLPGLDNGYVMHLAQVVALVMYVLSRLPLVLNTHCWLLSVLQVCITIGFPLTKSRTPMQRLFGTSDWMRLLAANGMEGSKPLVVEFHTCFGPVSQPTMVKREAPLDSTGTKRHLLGAAYGCNLPWAS